MVLEGLIQSLHVLGKHSSTELYLKPSFYNLFLFWRKVQINSQIVLELIL